MYPSAFRYHRAKTIEEAASLLAELGPEARVLAGGQSLVPLMKLRLASPTDVVDLNFVSGLSEIQHENGTVRFGAMTRHAAIESSRVARPIPIVLDCASGIADVQVRNRGTLGGSLAEADPSGDWGPVLLTLETSVHTVAPGGGRTIPLAEFFKDAYTTALAATELIRDVTVLIPPKGSAGAYVAFKRCAPVYATVSAAVQLTMDGDVCRDAKIALGCVGLTPIRPLDAEGALRGRTLNNKSIASAMEATRAAAEPQADWRGSAEYKRELVGVLARRAIETAARRCRGEDVAGGHIYV